MAGDPFGLLLRQRIVFLGGEVSCVCSGLAGTLGRHIPCQPIGENYDF